MKLQLQVTHSVRLTTCRRGTPCLPPNQLRFQPQLKLSLLPHANYNPTHSAFTFSVASSTCSQSHFQNPNTIEYA